MARSPKQGSHERGAVLVTGLIVLVVMTIIGVSSMQTTVLEERMAGNLRDQNVAFQAAEAGLQAGLTYLESQQNPPHVDDSASANIWPGCGVEDTGTDCSRGSVEWLGGDTEDADGTRTPNGILYDDTDLGGTRLTGVAYQPRIVIEERYVPPLEFEAAALGSGIHFYTVSALAHGATAHMTKLLQTTIAKVYAW